MNPSVFLLAIPAFLLLIGIEWLFSYLRRRNYYRFNDAIVNLSIGVGFMAMSLFIKALTFGLYIWVESEFAFWHQPVTWWSFVLCLVTYDFLFYWAHRWGHTVNFFWAAHVVHHSSEEYNLSVALRQSWWHNLLAFAIFMPMPFMGFDPKLFGAALAFDTLYQFWIHTKTIGKLHPWIEFIFNTPSHHRVHHGRDPKYIDKNHGGVFIIWDRLFGTFQAEEEEPHYGITTPLGSWNPVWANLHYYSEMWAKMKQMRSWKDRLRLLFAKPGWQPEYMGGFQKPPEIDTTQPEQKYDPPASKPFRLYVAVQFVLVILGLMAYVWHYPELDWVYRVAFFGIIVLSIMICGALLENKRWVLRAEYGRLALVVVCLNTLYYYQYLDWFLVMLVASMAGFVGFNLWFTLSWLFLGKQDRKKSSMRFSEDAAR